MGNNSTSLNSSSAVSSTLSSVMNYSFNYSSNHSSSFASGGFSLWYLMGISVSLIDIMNQCVVTSGIAIYLTLKIIILLTALPANSVLMWLLFKSRHNLSPSQLLGLNVSIVDVLYCAVLPFEIFSTLYTNFENIHYICESLSVLNYFGCPLLLTFMCLERYIAAAFPITYLRLGKWKYRIMICVLAWILILCMASLIYFYKSFTLHLVMVVIIFVFFLIMLVCLVGIVRVLCQVRPGDGASRSDSLKKRAFNNVLLVTIPAVITYFPLLIIIGLIAEIISEGSQTYTSEECRVMQVLLAFPNFGLYIGPLFYLSRIRQLVCCKKQIAHTMSRTQAE